MSYLVASIPPIEVFIRKEFLYDFNKDNKGKLLDENEYEWHLQPRRVTKSRGPNLRVMHSSPH